MNILKKYDFRRLMSQKRLGDYGLTLVRPDGYIAYSARAGEEELRTIRAMLELQTKSSNANVAVGK